MTYDDERQLPNANGPGQRASESFPTTYQTALAIWVGPALVVGMLMGTLNLRTYDSMISINPDDGEDFMRTEQRTGCGWPYVLASEHPATKSWSLVGFGLVIDGIIVFAAMVITAGTTRFVGAIIDDKVSEPIPKQIRRFLRGRPQKVAPKRSGPSGRRPSSGAAPVRRPRRPVDD